MFYEMQRGRVGIVSFEELKNDFVMYRFPEDTVLECERNIYNFRSDTYVSDDLIFVVIDLINLIDVFGEKSRVAIYARKDLCIIVNVKDENGYIKQQFEEVVNIMERSGKGIRHSFPEKFLCMFLNRFIQEDRKFIENMEVEMNTLETRMMKEHINASFINDILLIKKELMHIWNYYEQLIDVGDVFKHNENEMFPEENIVCFSVFTQRVSRISESVKYLKEYTVQLQETYDAMIDYNLNNIMKLFTVITTVFLPLTLIVGWYGMNFENMPELTWKYGYLCVILVSAAVVAISVIAFKKHKLL